MKVLLLSKYGRLGASSRIRSLQYISFLRKNGISTDVSPLFDNDYVLNLYKNRKRSLKYIIKRYILRLQKIVNLYSYDLLWIEKELFPMFPAWFEQLISLRVPYIVDYDDAVFHNYDLNTNRFVRIFLGRKIDTVMKCAKTVIAGNEYLAKRATEAGAKNVVIIPSVVDVNKYHTKKNYNSNFFTIGWIGSPSTTKYLNIVKGALNEFCNRVKNCRIMLVGAGDNDVFNGAKDIDVEVRKWSEDTEVKDIVEFDVGIMPLSDGFWERGKCGFKLIQYMACGVPVIGSPVGANKEIIIDGVNGFKVETEVEWVNAFNKIYKSSNLRMKLGLSGRKLVEDQYSLQVTAPKILNILNEISLHKREVVK